LVDSVAQTREALHHFIATPIFHWRHCHNGRLVRTPDDLFP
jgi:hypothetical protein